MANVIISGVDYSRFFDDLRAVIRQEIKEIAAETAQKSAPEVGGIELAMQVTGLSKARIYNLVAAGEIPNAKRGNRLYFNRAELLGWIAQGRRGATV